MQLTLSKKIVAATAITFFLLVMIFAVLPNITFAAETAEDTCSGLFF